VSGQLHASATLPPGKELARIHRIGGWVGPRIGLNDVEKRKFLNLLGLELRTFSHPARSQSLYRVRYPGSQFHLCKPEKSDLCYRLVYYISYITSRCFSILLLATFLVSYKALNIFCWILPPSFPCRRFAARSGVTNSVAMKKSHSYDRSHIPRTHKQIRVTNPASLEGDWRYIYTLVRKFWLLMFSVVILLFFFFVFSTTLRR
jgi:hypothetical protein